MEPDRVAVIAGLVVARSVDPDRAALAEPAVAKADVVDPYVQRGGGVAYVVGIVVERGGREADRSQAHVLEADGVPGHVLVVEIGDVDVPPAIVAPSRPDEGLAKGSVADVLDAGVGLDEIAVAREGVAIGERVGIPVAVDHRLDDEIGTVRKRGAIAEAELGVDVAFVAEAVLRFGAVQLEDGEVAAIRAADADPEIAVAEHAVGGLNGDRLFLGLVVAELEVHLGLGRSRERKRNEDPSPQPTSRSPSRVPPGECPVRFGVFPSVLVFRQEVLGKLNVLVARLTTAATASRMAAECEADCSRLRVARAGGHDPSAWGRCAGTPTAGQRRHLSLSGKSAGRPRPAREDGKMTRTRRFFSRFASAFRTFGSANRVASAVEYGRSPAPTDLERLGISVVAFGAINRN